MRRCMFMCQILARVTPAGSGSMDVALVEIIVEFTKAHIKAGSFHWMRDTFRAPFQFVRLKRTKKLIVLIINICTQTRVQTTGVHLRRGFLRSSVQLAKSTSQTYSYRLYLSFPKCQAHQMICAAGHEHEGQWFSHYWHVNASNVNDILNYPSCSQPW